MPFASNQGVRIHYEVEGEGPPLVLQHGRFSDLGAWRRLGFVDALKQDYRLILIDARGHGKSDKPHDPQAYHLALMAGDETAVLDELGIVRTHFLGYSMGGWIGFAVARFAPGRLSSLITGGAPPYEQASPGELDPSAEAMIPLLRQGAAALVAAMGEKYSQLFTLADIDTEALIAQYSLQGPAGLADDLPAMAVPCLLYAGEEDPNHADARRCSETMPNAIFVSIPGADHIEGAVRTDFIIPHIRSFLTEVIRAQDTE
jgi:pimeloyl-ACP methyl ester carboxylesterase